MTTSIKIIDNKKISMTSEEWELYQSICRSYDRPNFKGDDLFKNLFETDNEGIIIFVRPPSSKYTSMEVFLFVSSIMLHQHIRQMHMTASVIYRQMDEKIQQLDNKIKQLDCKLQENNK